MEEAKVKTTQQQEQEKQQQQQLLQQHQQQQMMLLQQLQRQQASAISRFPSNIDAHLRPMRSMNLQPNQNQNSNPNPNPNPVQVNQQQKVNRPGPGSQMELQMAYQDAWRVCHPDFKRPFSSLEDACDRLLPYHVVADYEAEEDDRMLDSDTTGQMLSRSQLWDNNIAAKIAEFTATFEKQALAFNIITRKRAMGEFRSEERLMIEQALLQEEKRAMLELRAAMVQAEQARADSQSHAEMMMARAPLRGSALGSQGSDDIVHDMGEQDHGGNHTEMINGWGKNSQKDEKEPSDDFLNDEETENGETSTQDGWREAGEFDLNAR
ncbi:hypothetical protein TanjilG_11886 [Lupinus angustifolius]|uniref:GLTSCR protein conserved domain-containing protein n=1 Tax=Lupinus angustifolius TaxID=3871 RepID=A0A394DBH7_LUPAN|nr:PREDICTED: PH domain-containing protein DDB_G0275795-like [Lupinus angustifolius]OIW20483.1 hypothetical protein TanjilG_11886 [Lupinus angustifolius]